MNKTMLIEKTKDLIAEGYTDQAIVLVEGFLANKPEYKLLHTESLHLAALFNKTKQEQANRTISFDNAELNYGKVRQGLFNLLDFIEKDNLNPANLQSTSRRSWKQALLANKLLLIIGVPLILISTAVFILVNKIDGNDGQSDACDVQFEDETAKNFLLLPFYKPAGDEIQPEGLIIERLEGFCAGIESLKKSAFEICNGFKPDRLLNFEEATNQGNENKATVVIWGRAEKNGSTTVIKTRFKFLGGTDTIPFTQLKQGEQQVATDKVLSIITSSGELTQDLETTLKLIVGMVANIEGNQEGAIRALQAAQVTDSTANLLKFMMLADNFIAMNEPDKAQSALDTCLAVNKKYWLGRNNRANLRIESGDNLGAVEDLNVALTKRPEDTDMLMARGTAYKNSQQLYAAKEDFEKVIQLKPEAEPQVREALKEINVEIRSLKNIFEPTIRRMNTNNLTKQEYLQAADASNKLGDIATTKQLVKKGLAMDNNNPKLIAIQIDNLLKEKDPVKAKEVLKAAMKRNVRKEEIAKYSKNVAELLRQMNLRKEFEIE